MKNLNLFGLLLVGGVCLPLLHGAPATTPASSSRWIPAQAAVCVEVLAPQPLAEALLSPRFQQRVASLPIVEQGRSSPGYIGVMGLVGYLELTAGTNWQTLVRRLSSHGLALSLGEGNRHLLVLEGEDPDLLDKLHKLAQQIASGEAQKRGQPEQVCSTSYGDVTGWSFDGREAHAVLGSRLLAASDPEVLQAAIDLPANPGASLAERPDYRAARQALGDRALAMVFIDLQQLRRSPQFASALEAQRQNPLSALLLAGLPDRLRQAPWAAVGVYPEANGLSLRACTGPVEAQQEAATTAPASERLKPCPVVPRLVASLSLNRDLAAFYAAKDELFPQRTSGLIFFENMMGIFFSGRNLTDEVLAALRPDLRLVVARQDYDPAIGTPEPQLPGFALLLDLKDPEAFAEVLEEAWQKALGLVNFTRGQQALPGLILDREEHGDTTLTVAAYSARDVPDRSRLDQRYNFRPTLAVSHGTAILSSTDQLARDLIDATRASVRPPAETPAKTDAVLQLRGQELSTLLRGNRAALVRNNMVKEGKTETEAGLGIDTLLALAGWVESLQLTVAPDADPRWAELQLTLAEP